MNRMPEVANLTHAHAPKAGEFHVGVTRARRSQEAKDCTTAM